MMVFPKKAEGGGAGGASGANGGSAASPAGFPKIPVLPDARKRAENDAATGQGRTNGPPAATMPTPRPQAPAATGAGDAKPEPAKADAAPAADAAAAKTDARPDASAARAAETLQAQPALQRLLTDVRRDLEQTVNREMKRVEQEFGSIVNALSHQLVEAREQAEKYRRESSALREANETMEKKVRVLRELQERLKDV